MKTLTLIFALLVGSLPANAQYSGLGASTTSCLDKDGDLYGVGPLKIAATDLAMPGKGISRSSNMTVVSGGSGGVDGGQDVTFTNGGGSGATGRINVIGGVPTGAVSFNSNSNPGTGYTSVPTQGTVSTVSGTVTFTGGALASEFTSASHPFTNYDVRRNIVVTAGSGFTVGTYQVSFIVPASNIALADQTAGTSGSTGGSYNIAGCLGPDADDRDTSVHSTSQALTKYGTVQAFYAHAGAAAGDAIDIAAYTPLQYWVVAPSGGNDGTCTAHTFGASPDPTAVTACATINHVNANSVAGDMMILRGGTHLPGIALSVITSGTAAHPISMVAYPGEQPIIDFNGAGGLSYDAMSYWIIDGVEILNATFGAISGGSAYGGPPYLTTGPSRSQGIRIRNVEIALCVDSVYLFDGLADIIVEDNVLHDADTVGGTHNLYMGGRSNPSSALTIQRNIMYGGGYTGMQFNGRTTALTAQNNLIYGNTLGCISMEMGVSSSTFINNTCIGNGRSAIVFYDYESGACYNGSGILDPAGTFGICPWAQNNNLIENNSIYMGEFDFKGNSSTMAAQPCLLTINDASLTAPHDFTGNVFRNNACSNWDGYLGDIGAAGSPTLAQTQLTLDSNIYIALNRAGTGVMRDLPNAATLTFAQMAVLTGFTVTNNSISNPLYTAANVNWWSNYANYDLSLQPTSSGINAGSTTSAPVNDFLGNQRTVTPSIGAYQYASGGTTLPLNTWTNFLTHGQPIQAVGWEKMAYSRASKRSVFQGDFHQQSNEPNTSLNMFDFETGRWDIMQMTGLFHDEMMPEAGHQDGLFGYDSTRNLYTSVCCMTFGRQPENPYHTWQYDPVGQVGRDRHTTPAPNPGSGNQGTAAYDAAHDRFILFLPDNAGGTGAQTWEYNASANVWTLFTPSPTPRAGLQQPSMAYNSDDGHVYLFGGEWGGAIFYNNVWKYDQPTHTWTDLSISGSKPAGRYEAGWAYDTINHVFMCFGGFIDDGTTLVSDAWVFDPVAIAWTQVASLTPNAFTSSPQTYERMTFDQDHNAFIIGTTGTGNGVYASDAQSGKPNFATQTWLFRYNGVGPTVAMLPNTAPTVTAGSINRNVGGWSAEPTVAVNSSTVYAGWSEVGINADTTEGFWAHTYASQFSGSWSVMGLTSAALNPEISACASFTVEAHQPTFAYINSTPWISYYAGCEQEDEVYAKSWGGSSWTGGVVGKVNPFGLLSTEVFQGRSYLTGVGTVPHVAFIENERLVGSGNQEEILFVKSWNGSAWSLVGGYLNRGRTAATNAQCVPSTAHCSRAESVAITSNGSNPIVAFTEYLTNDNDTDTLPQVFVSQWSGSAWTQLGSGLNTASTWAQDVTITYMGGQPYVAYVERTQSGVSKVFVKTWNGSSWSLVGSGSLNRDTSTGYAFRPSLTNDGTNLFLGWVEQQDIGQKGISYVSKWNGSAWSNLGASLNMADSGSAQHIQIAIYSGQPLAVWSEVNFGAYRQIYAKAYNGSAWVSIGPAGSCTITTSSFPNATAGSPYSQTAAETGCSSSSWTVATGSLPGWASLNSSTGAITGTASGSGTDNFTLTYDTATSGPLSITTNAAPGTGGFTTGGRLTVGGKIIH